METIIKRGKEYTICCHCYRTVRSIYNHSFTTLCINARGVNRIYKANYEKCLRELVLRSVVEGDVIKLQVDDPGYISLFRVDGIDSVLIELISIHPKYSELRFDTVYTKHTLILSSVPNVVCFRKVYSHNIDVENAKCAYMTHELYRNLGPVVLLGLVNGKYERDTDSIKDLQEIMTGLFDVKEKIGDGLYKELVDAVSRVYKRIE